MPLGEESRMMDRFIVLNDQNFLSLQKKYFVFLYTCLGKKCIVCDAVYTFKIQSMLCIAAVLALLLDSHSYRFLKKH